MTRQDAALFAHQSLQKHGLLDWHVRLNSNPDSHYLGLCLHKDKVIVLNAEHIDIHPDPDIRNTVLHEVAHALTPGNGHNNVWAECAKRIGCDNVAPCSNLSLSPDIIDAIRSGATVEVTFDEHVVRTPKYNITRLQDKCDICGKVAKLKSESTITVDDDAKPNLKIITLECGHIVVKQIPKGTPFHKFQMGGDPNCKHEWEKNRCLKCGRFRPYQYQIEGMQFLEAGLAVNKGAACFDEMGLGKTQQAGGVLFFHPEYLPALWVVKSGTKWQFAKFLVQWLGNDHVPQVIESGKDCLIPGLKHYIIGYDMMVPKVKKGKNGKLILQGFDIEKFNERGIKTVVLDECQQIKNAGSGRTQQVRKLCKDKKVLPLSGTPWKNKGSELFPVFNMLDPTKFWAEKAFKDDWVGYWWDGRFKREGGIRNPKRFKEFVKDICIRRERSEVMKELPLVNRTKLYVRMTPQQETVYDDAVQAFVDWYEQQEADCSSVNILGQMARMRHLIALAKMPVTKEYVDEFIEDTDRKLVIFAHHQDVQDLLYTDLKAKYDIDDRKDEDGTPQERIPVFKLFSNMNALERHQVQEKFNAAPRCILVASQQAAGEGLNLQTCSDCIMHERQWNPANEEQCEGRFIRIGQTATTVNAVYAHCEGLSTIDPHLDNINERKRLWFHAAMNSSKAPTWNEHALIRELADAIVRAHKQKKAA